MDLKQVIATISDLTQQKSGLENRNDEFAARIERLESKLATALRALRGNRSEKLDPAELLDGCYDFLTQEELDLIGEIASGSDEPEDEVEIVRRKKKKKKLSTDGLEERTEKVVLPKNECDCEHCGRLMPVVGYDPTQKFGHQPAVFYVKSYLLEKRACPCGKGIARAKVPPHPIPRCKALPDLLAQIIVAKFVDGLPLYRQSKIYERAGIAIGDTTLGEWCRQSADVFAPVVTAVLQQVRNEDYLQADETGLRVQAKGGCEKGWLWAYGRPNGQVYFDFRPGRSRDGPNEILESYRGKLQTDGYSVYEGLAALEDHFACMSHARRYFVDAKKKSKKRSGEILKLVQKLYRIEREAKDRGLTFEQRRAHRKARATPILQAIEESLKTYQAEPEFLPKSDFGKAVNYMSRRWKQLTRYVEHGEVEIDNNLIENSMRGIAVTRKNFLFAGSDAGAERAAVFYTLVESCRRLGINPHEYLTDVLARIPTTAPADMPALTPKSWLAARPSA